MATAPGASESSSPPSSQHPSGKEESSVRGGKLFAHMFGSNSANHNNNNSHHNTNTVLTPSVSAASPSFLKGGRKVKSFSCDELDGTLRRGTEKAYSPGNARFAVSTAVSATTAPPPVALTSSSSVALAASSAAPEASPPPPPPTTLSSSLASSSLPAFDAASAAPAAVYLRPRSELYRHASVGGGTGGGNGSQSGNNVLVVYPPSQHRGGGGGGNQPYTPQQQQPRAAVGVVAQEQQPQQQQQQQQLTGSSTSAMKKAFTEFHNSSATGRDAVSAYLGDEPSHKSRATVGHSLAWTARIPSNPPLLSYRNKFSYSLGEFSDAIPPAIPPTLGGGAVPPPPQPSLPLPPPSPSRGPPPSGDIVKRSPTSTAANPSSSSFTGGDDELSKPLSAAAAAAMLPRSWNSRLSGTTVPSSNVTAGLETVHESPVLIRSHVRTLKPVQSVDAWQPGRRYLIAPAALAACPVAVLSTLAPGPSRTATQVYEQYRPQNGTIGDPPGKEASSRAAYGTIVLGKCLMASTPGHPGGPQSKGAATAAAPHMWSESVLVLKQNYLLEYPVTHDHGDAAPRGVPRGLIHLPHAVCRRHGEAAFRRSLHLEFYGSPCAKSDPRVLHLQLDARDEPEAWTWCLNRAAQLTIEDLYEYNPSDLLGKGTYANVYAGRRRSQLTRNGDENTGNDSEGASAVTPLDPACALKIFDKNQYWRMVVKGRERADTLVRETSVQATLTAKCSKVPSFVRIRGFFETTDHVVLELELLEGGVDLFKYISARGVLKEIKAAQILYDILTALDAMNKIGLAHRDVKPANVLMMPAASSGSPSCKLADFGMSTFAGVDGQLRGRCGTPGFVAPEIFSAGVHGGYGNKVDVFSAGVTLYVMLCGYEPFYGETDAELVAANKAASIEFPDDEWKGISPQARELVHQMMHPDPRFRLSPSQVLQHPWLGQVQRLGNGDRDRNAALSLVVSPLEDVCTVS